MDGEDQCFFTGLIESTRKIESSFLVFWFAGVASSEFWVKKKPDHLSMIGFGFGFDYPLTIDDISEETALEKDITCFCIVVVVEEISHVSWVFLGHDLNTFLDGFHIETLGFRVFIFHISHDDGSSVVQGIIQMAIDLIFIGAEGESLGLDKLLDLIPVVAATFKSRAQEIGDTIQCDLMLDAHGDGWLWCLCFHNREKITRRFKESKWFFPEPEIIQEKKILYFLFEVVAGGRKFFGGKQKNPPPFGSGSVLGARKV